MFFVVRHKPTDRRPKKKQRKLAASMGVPFPRDVQCSDAEKCMLFQTLKGESPPHPRTIAPTSLDPNTAEPTLARWRLTSCHGAGDENGVSAPLSPSHRCRRHSSPLEGSNPLVVQKSGILTPSWGNASWKPHDFSLGFGVLYILWTVVVLEFWSINSMYGIFTYSCFIFYGTCMQM